MPENQIASWLREAPVTILIGPDTTKYFIPKKLLLRSGLPFFKAAFTNPAYEECKTGTMELPEEDPRAFDLFVDWLFFHNLSVLESLPEHHTIPLAKMVEVKMLEHEEPWHHLLCMASKFCCPELEKDALERIKSFHKVTRTVCHPQLLRNDLSNSPPAKGLLDYILQEFLRIGFGPAEDFATMSDFMHKDCPDLMIKGVKRMQEHNLSVPKSRKVNGLN